MFGKAIDAVSDQEWDQAVTAHLDWGQAWRGDLPADLFFGVWASLSRQVQPLAVQV